MRIIQTFKDESLKCGFPTRESCIEYLKKSLAIHTAICETLIYTDQQGYEHLSKYLPIENLVLTEFEHIDGRFWNLCKLQTQLLQGDVIAIHVDIDATMYEWPVTDKPVITEGLRGNFVMQQYSRVGLYPRPLIPCSGLLGFKDIALRDYYIATAIKMIREWSLEYVDDESRITVEELSLANICEISDFYELPKGTFEHLQGGQKK